MPPAGLGNGGAAWRLRRRRAAVRLAEEHRPFWFTNTALAKPCTAQRCFLTPQFDIIIGHF